MGSLRGDTPRFSSADIVYLDPQARRVGRHEYEFSVTDEIALRYAS